MLASVLVADNLETLYFFTTPLPQSTYSHLVSSEVLKTTSELINVLPLCKCFYHEWNAHSCSNFNCNTFVSLTISFLEKYCEKKLANVDEKPHISLVRFIIDQLSLIDHPKNGRHYSAEAVTTAFLWQLTSTSLYKKLWNLCILSSQGLLHKFSAGNDVKCCTLDLHYIRARYANLTPL